MKRHVEELMDSIISKIEHTDKKTSSTGISPSVQQACDYNDIFSDVTVA